MIWNGSNVVGGREHREGDAEAGEKVIFKYGLKKVSKKKKKGNEQVIVPKSEKSLKYSWTQNILIKIWDRGWDAVLWDTVFFRQYPKSSQIDNIGQLEFDTIYISFIQADKLHH